MLQRCYLLLNTCYILEEFTMFFIYLLVYCNCYLILSLSTVIYKIFSELRLFLYLYHLLPFYFYQISSLSYLIICIFSLVSYLHFFLVLLYHHSFQPFIQHMIYIRGYRKKRIFYDAFRVERKRCLYIYVTFLQGFTTVGQCLLFWQGT